MSPRRAPHHACSRVPPRRFALHDKLSHGQVRTAFAQLPLSSRRTRATLVNNTDARAVSTANNRFQPAAVVRSLLIEMWLLAQSFVLVCSPYSSLALLYDAAWGAFFSERRQTHLCLFHV